MTVNTYEIAKVDLSVVIPCLNEEETLAICIEKAQKSFREMNVSGEVVIADNGSTDNSKEIAIQLGAIVVDVPVRGYGAALLAGFQASRGEYIIMGDADDSYALDSLSDFYDKLRLGASLVMGDRFAGGIEKGAMPPLHKYLGNPVLSYIGRLFFGGEVSDFHCGLRGMNKSKILELDLRSKGMEFASEIVVKAQLHGLEICEVPTTLKKDGRSRKPHLRTWRDGWRHLRFLLSFSPRWLFFYPGLALCLIGTTSSIFLYFDKTITKIEFGPQTWMVNLILLLSGTQMIWFAILAKGFTHYHLQIPIDSKWKTTFKILSRESLYLIWIFLTIAGSTIIIWRFLKWAQIDYGLYGDPSIAKHVAIAAAMLGVSVQSMLSQILFNVIGLSSRD